MDALLPLRLRSAPPDSFRLAVDLSTMLPGGANGGAKPFALEYLKALAELEGDRLTLVFLTWSCSHAEVRQLARPWDELICVRDTADTPGPAGGDWRRGETSIKEPPPDLLLHLEVYLLYSPLSCFEHACPGVPLLTTIVDVLHRDYPATLRPIDVTLREANFRLFVKATSLFQCISDHTIQRMIAHYGVDAGRLFRTHIVIQHRLPEAPASGNARPTPRPYFFYPANAWRHKNHETLLVAYRLYRQQAGVQAWHLVLTGHEDERMHSVLATARALGLQDFVHFCGHLPPGEFATLWQSAGALIFPSLHEGFGIPLLEAMHFRLPILCSSAGSLPEVAADAALYADALDPIALSAALQRLASDKALRTDLIARGQQRLKEFSLQKEAGEFRDRLYACAKIEAPLWTKGWHPDGWIEKKAVVALPRYQAPGILRVKFAPSPTARRLRVYLGTIFFGGFDLPAWENRELSLEVRLDGAPLVLEVPDAGNLNPQDHRCHGVILSGVSVHDANAVEVWRSDPAA